MKLVPTSIIVNKKLNNIMIKHLQNSHASVLPNKWRFDLSKNWEIFALDFGGFSMDNIAEKTLRTLGFHISTTGYLKKESPYFTDVTNLELTAKLVMVNNLGQVVTDFKEEVVKKKNKYVAKRKQWLAKLHVLVGSFLSPHFESSLLSSPCSMPAPMPALVPAPEPAFIPTPVPDPVPAPFLCLGCFVFWLCACSGCCFLSQNFSFYVATSCTWFTFFSWTFTSHNIQTILVR